jgi:hypothetical protein
MAIPLRAARGASSGGLVALAKEAYVLRYLDVTEYLALTRESKSRVTIVRR